MASQQQLLVVVVVVTVAAILTAAPAPALAADILVGDSQGWSLEVDYDDWVNGNDFIVGDTLVFKYATARHSVVQATAASFAACSQDNSLGVWTSGDDRVALNASGHWWFFCGVEDHCQQGMRFHVTVLPVVELSPSPLSPPTRDATGLAASARGGGLAAAGLAAAAAVAAVAALLF